MSEDQLFSLGEAELRRRGSAKWRAYPPDVLPLWIAEMDVRLAPPVEAALHAAIEDGDTGYPWGDGYARAWSHFAAARWGQELDPDDIRTVADVMHGIVEAVAVVAAPGAPVVVTPPVYPPFFGFLRSAGRRVLTAPLGPDGRLDPETLDAACAAAGRGAVLLLCSPHNPTGAVHTATELAAVAELAERHGLRVVVDEIHAPLVPAGATFVPYLTVPGTDSAVVAVSASKAWNLAGLKAALLVAGPRARADLARLPEEVPWGASRLGVLAHTVALTDGVVWLDRLLVELADQRDLLGELLATRLPGVRYRPPQGTYFAWLDCRALGLGDDPAATLLRDARVAVNSGPTFGEGGKGHVRLNLAASPVMLTAALDRMATVIERARPVRPEDTLTQ